MSKMGSCNLLVYGVLLLFITGINTQYSPCGGGSPCQTPTYQTPIYQTPQIQLPRYQIPQYQYPQYPLNLCGGGGYPCGSVTPSCPTCQGGYYPGYPGYSGYSNYGSYQGSAGYPSGVQVIRAGSPNYEILRQGFQGGYQRYPSVYPNYQGGYGQVPKYVSQTNVNGSVSNQTTNPYPYPYYTAPVYPRVQNYPNYYPYVQYRPLNSTASNSTVETTTKDPFANVTTDFVDVEPQRFNNLMNFYHLQPQIQPIRARSPRYYQPTYKVFVDSKQSNFTEKPPTVFTKHEVQNKKYSFRKTFVLTPENRSSVINLHFLNGEPVNQEETPGGARENVKEEIDTEPAVTTTEESEKPVGVNNWLKF